MPPQARANHPHLPIAERFLSAIEPGKKRPLTVWAVTPAGWNGTQQRSFEHSAVHRNESCCPIQLCEESLPPAFVIRKVHWIPRAAGAKTFVYSVNEVLSSGQFSKRSGAMTVQYCCACFDRIFSQEAR